MLDMVLPPRCAGCGQVGSRWCSACIEKCVLVDDNVCSLCGKPKLVQGSVHQCARKYYLEDAYAWGKYQDPLRKAIRRLKYSRDIGLGDALAQHLVWLTERNKIGAEMVIPVPLGKKRHKERGYNQAALLARSLALVCGIPIQTSALVRTRETASQVGLSLEERRLNVAGAFTADAGKVKGKRVLLVDDVLTTGATLEAAAEALRMAGTRKIEAVVVARA